MLPDRPVTGRLDPQRQPEDLDEPDRAGVVERVALVVRGERLVVQRHRRAPPDDDRRAVIQPHPDLARDDPLRRRDVRPQVARQRAEPQAVVDQPRQLVGHEPVEPQRVARQRQPLERPVSGVQDRRRRRLVDLAALDPDQPILDVVDPPDAVRAAKVVDALDQVDGREPLPVERHRDPALEVDHDLDRGGRIGRRATVHSNASAGGVTHGSSRTPVSHERPHRLTSIEYGEALVIGISIPRSAA